MKYTLALTTLFSIATAATIPATLLQRQSSVCGALQTPLCCQLDVEGVANLNCVNAGPVESTEGFEALCAETGTSAQCCVLALGADGLLCTGA